MKTLNTLALTTIVAVGMTFNAGALSLTPASGSLVAQGTDPVNPDADDMEDITGSSPLTLVYKNDQKNGDPDGEEEGSFAGSYTTTYSNTADDPEDATIEYDGGPSISGNPIYLLVKDGAAHDPVWYVFDISGWNGTDTIELTGFWPQQGAISHVSIYTGGGGTQVPDAGSTLALLGLALTSIGVLRRKLA